MHSNVAALHLLGADPAARVRARVPDVITTIEAASRVAWLPLSLDIALSEAVCAVVGDEGALRHSRLALEDSLKTPLLRPLKAGARALLDGQPQALLRFAARNWHHVFKDACDADFRPGRLNTGTFELRSCAPEILASRGWVVSTAGFLQGLVAELSVEASITHRIDVDDAVVSYLVGW